MPRKYETTTEKLDRARAIDGIELLGQIEAHGIDAGIVRGGIWYLIHGIGRDLADVRDAIESENNG